jgi:hypothetical protein
MAPVFDGKTKVGRTVADPNTDQTLPPAGQLEYFIIDADAALGITVGKRCTLVHGNHWVEIDKAGNSTVNIWGNLNTSVFVTETHTVTQNRTVTVANGNNSLSVGGNQDWTISGSHMALHTGPKTETLVSPLSIIQSSPELQSEPTAKLHLFGVDFEKKDQEFTYVVNSFEIHAISNEITYGFKNEATLLNNEVKVVDYATVLGVSIEPKVSEVELEPLKTWLKGAEAGAEGGKATAGAGVGVPPNPPTAGSK